MCRSWTRAGAAEPGERSRVHLGVSAKSAEMIEIMGDKLTQSEKEWTAERVEQSRIEASGAT